MQSIQKVRKHYANSPSKLAIKRNSKIDRRLTNSRSIMHHSNLHNDSPGQVLDSSHGHKNRFIGGREQVVAVGFVRIVVNVEQQKILVIIERSQRETHGCGW